MEKKPISFNKYKSNAGFFRKLWIVIERFEEREAFFGLLAIFLFFSLATPFFFTMSNLSNVSRQVALLGILAVGMTYVLVIGEVDLSIGSIFGLTMMVMALLLKEGTNVWVSMLIAWLVGALCGAINGCLSIILRVPTIIVTLGTMNIFRGITWWSSGGWPVEQFSKTGLFFQLGVTKIGGVIPVLTIIMLIMVIIGSLILSKTSFGRHIYATGGNLQAAKYFGVRVNRIRLISLMFMGLMSGISGTSGLAHLTSADPNSGTGYELDVIAAVIIGGTKLGGGAGTVLGSLLGIFIIGILRNGLVLIGASVYTQVIVSGGIIILAVAIGRFAKR